MKPLLPQRRRRDIFVESAHKKHPSPVGATYSAAVPDIQPRTTRTARKEKCRSRIWRISRSPGSWLRPLMSLLRSCDSLCVTFYKYAAPLVLLESQRDSVGVIHAAWA